MSPQRIGFVEASNTGAGLACLVAAARRGYESVLFTNNAENVPVEIGAQATVVSFDTNDVVGFVDKASEWAERHGIDAIMTTSDFYVRQAAALADSLGLPGPTAAVAGLCHNKALLRAKLDAESLGKLNPEYALVTGEMMLRCSRTHRTVDHVSFPFVVKRVDANDSYDVGLITDWDDFEAYSNRVSRTAVDASGQPYSDLFLVETFASGTEYSVEALVDHGGQIEILGAFIKEAQRDLRYPFIKRGAAFPYDGDDIQMLYECAGDSLRAIKAGAGAYDIDCRFAGNSLKILEINGRMIGDQMGSHMIPLATGFDLADAAVGLALGESTQVPRGGGRRPVGIYRILAPHAGVFHGIANLAQLQREPGVAHVHVLVAPGERVAEAQSNADVIASVMAFGMNTASALVRARTIAELAHVDLD